MPVKPHFDFAVIDMTEGWETPPGYPAGVKVKVLAGGLDEVAKKGHRTTITRFAPGTVLESVPTHDFVEEVIALEGELLCYAPADGRIVGRVTKHSYVCRQPGVPHGPFRTETGYMSMQFCYYP
ncbi:MAG: hypothetical protein WD270_02605 [Acetobacterales bacterium]